MAKISAIDLHTVGERTRRHFFDQRTRYSGKDPLPTMKQNQEWDARLFWGDRTISLVDEDRYNWVITMALNIKENWNELRQNMNIELGIEMLWVIMKSQLLQQDSDLDLIEKEIMLYFYSNGFDKNALEARIASLE